MLRALTVALALLGLQLAGAAPAQAEPCPKGGACASPGAAADAAPQPAPMAFDLAPAVGTRARCPVMGGTFTVSEKTQRSEYQGKHYAFCCPGCKPKFDADPERYLKKAE